MLKFKKVRWKNFLSTGDTFTEVDLSSYLSTLIVGINGSGKSTLIDVLCFVLFNKPSRNINKPQLINSVNNKDCLGEVEFETLGSEWLVRRGMRPNVFEIYRDGELQDQNSSSTEQQKNLEQSILRMNMRTLGQVVVLGSSSYIPFMQLSPGARREIIESLLDIDIFTKMNKLLKDQTSLLKDQIKDCDTEIRILESKIKNQEKFISELQGMNEDLISEKASERDKVAAKLKEDRTLIKKLRKRVEAGLNEYDRRKYSLDKEIVLVRSGLAVAESNRDRATENLAKFMETELCPTCNQKVHGSEYLDKLKAEEDETKELVAGLLKDSESLTKSMTDLDLIRAAIKQDEDQITKLSSDIASSERALQTLEADVARLQERVGGVEAAEFDLTSMRVDMNALGARKNELTEDMSYNTLMLEMLKDTGLKSKVVQQHLPVINAKINQYLGVLDFFVSFNLDESFNETIKSRFRDEFSYSSFSEGEKAKIDLALLFTWRHIGRRLNSVHTNLIVLDEVADSSLDAEGIEHLMAIIETLEEDANVFVISHRAVNESRFSNKIVFEKKGNFSRMIQD